MTAFLGDALSLFWFLTCKPTRERARFFKRCNARWGEAVIRNSHVSVTFYLELDKEFADVDEETDYVESLSVIDRDKKVLDCEIELVSYHGSDED